MTNKNFAALFFRRSFDSELWLSQYSGPQVLCESKSLP